MMTGAVVAVILMSLYGAYLDLSATPRRPRKVRESRALRRHANKAIKLTGGKR